MFSFFPPCFFLAVKRGLEQSLWEGAQGNLDATASNTLRHTAAVPQGRAVQAAVNRSISRAARFAQHRLTPPRRGQPLRRFRGSTIAATPSPPLPSPGPHRPARSG